jgi:nucleoside-diphosphate-sugar epimerase
MAKVLVTGGAGYIGSVLVPALLERGHDVTVVDSFTFGQVSLSHVCHDTRFRLVRGDVRSVATMARLEHDADIIIPLAALVGAPLCDRDPIAAVTVNRDAVLEMLGRISRDQRVLMPVSNSGYGVGEPGKHCTEETPMRPLSLYGRTKVEAEQALLDRHANAISFRLATVFGMSPRMRFDLLVNDFTLRAWRDRFVIVFEGHFKRNYVHIRDVARAFLHGIDHFDSMRGRAYNVGLSDANLSKLELCDRIRRQVPDFVCLESPINEDPDKRDYIVSNARIAATGYRPAWSLQRGITELIKGYTILRNSTFANV